MQAGDDLTLPSTSEDEGPISFETKKKVPRSLDEQYAAYETNVKELVSYLKLYGMFELKDGQSYDIYNNINKDPFTWKEYDLGKGIVKN